MNPMSPPFRSHVHNSSFDIFGAKIGRLYVDVSKSESALCYNILELLLDLS